MALVACKACGKEIGKSVKKCVHCGTDQRNFFAKHKIITGILALVLISVVGAALGGGEEGGTTATNSGSGTEQTTETEQTSEIETEAKQKLGTPFKTEDFETTVVSVKVKGKVGVEFVSAKPAEGGEYIAVVWKYKNITKKPIGMFGQPSLKLVDPDGTEYDPDLNASSSYATEKKLTEKILSDLNPGITVTGAEVFEVAKGQYDPATWNVVVKADEDVVVGLK